MIISRPLLSLVLALGSLSVGCVSAQKERVEAAVTETPFNGCRVLTQPTYIDVNDCFDAETSRPGAMYVKPELLARLDFRNAKDGLVPFFDFGKKSPSPLFFETVVGYILSSGKAATVVFHDNGPDYFEGGLVRFVDDQGQVGFLDKNLDVAIEPEHDFVSPFRNGKAYYCDGCTREKAAPEVYKITGGQWGILNGKGISVFGPASEDTVLKKSRRNHK